MDKKEVSVFRIKEPMELTLEMVELIEHLANCSVKTELRW